MTFLLGNGTTENGYTLIKKNVFDEMFKPHISLPSGVIDVFSLIKPFPVVSSTSWYGYAWFGRNYRGKNKQMKKNFMHMSNLALLNNKMLFQFLKKFIIDFGILMESKIKRS